MVDLPLAKLLSCARSEPKILLSQWDEPGAVLQNYVTSPHMPPLFRFVISRKRPQLVRWFLCGLAYRRGSPARQRHILYLLRCGPGTPGGLRVGGHPHPAEYAVDPEHAAGERARDGRVEAVTIPSCAASSINYIHLGSAMTPSTSASTKLLNPATHAPRDVPSFDIVGEECLLQDVGAGCVDLRKDPRAGAPASPSRVTAALSRIEVAVVPVKVLTKRK
ncbi:hypothetical protein EDB92DRAFT_2103893 [Lactarius akahatsu]|uniref:Uncharacterized protein n=1 Tax=Lactarius akahatsu TaxID=416441 RepID=A0AAD4LGU4_9AGAM|nr:hypothetical protein EDB92DRAFT_2103893 [Lactarius akahatsu]